ncbi:TatD DNase family protein [Dysgonomonas sp. PH5-45]|uniref:TatD family hydrolase n=1 Tax=unclassified Dysgonomonas TaxID=2630389 RepID=UPI002473BE91|nr:MULTISPECIES: TatD family hydrolase [unclassified Dysgonomonas]MDH6356049.1 TatD DNase family protein [Dysgonomonas sp. PH5-45]MDH6388943.1 TatD DNase family protein [Dysgonomonas sp. PH5-37]
MNIIDTHTHIFEPEFDNDIADVIDRAQRAGVEKILLPNIDMDSISRLHNLSAAYPGYCLPMMGLHPTSVTSGWEQDLAEMKKLFATRKYIAVGEIGMDLYWDKSFAEEQRLAFEEQLRWSVEFNLPVSIHSREAIPEVIDSIKRIGQSELRGVFHSFGGTVDQLHDILSLGGFYLGINGVVTYKNSGLKDVLTHTNLSHIVVETDAPYLSPVPYRGKRNETAYTVQIIEKLADIYNVSPEEVGEVTSRNARKLFGL